MNKIKMFSLLGLCALPLFISAGEAPEGEEIIEPEGEPETEDVTEEVVEEYECKVIVPTYEHGEVKVDKLEGHVDEDVIINVTSNEYYVVSYVNVNNEPLVEDENVKGQYTFKLVEGENVIDAKFEVEDALVKEVLAIIEKNTAKDWTTMFFNFENIVGTLGLLLSSVVFVTMLVYAHTDKKLNQETKARIEKVAEETLPKIAKDAVVENTKTFVEPYFVKISAEMENMENALTVFSRCLALAQENTPEAKIAITRELSSLTLSDQVAINQVESRLKDFIVEQNDKMADLFAKLENIRKVNTEIIEKKEEPVKEEVKVEEKKEEVKKEIIDDGTQL